MNHKLTTLIAAGVLAVGVAANAANNDESIGDLAVARDLGAATACHITVAQLYSLSWSDYRECFAKFDKQVDAEFAELRKEQSK